MKRLIVAFTLALLFISAGTSQAQWYPRCYHYYSPRPVVCYRAYHRAWIPGFWRWNWNSHRYFRVPGYWY